MPFTVTDFLDVFRRYNEAVWPTQLALLMLGVAAVLLAALSAPRASVAASAILAALWSWMAFAYHLAFFASINPLARVFAAAFLVQALLLVRHGVWRNQLRLEARRDVPTVLAGLVIFYALIGYPALGYAVGHEYPTTPTFGVPCPTTIFTFGILLLARPPLPRSLLVIPTLWAMVATSAALSLGMHEDLGLPIAAALAVATSLARRHRAARGEPQRRTPVRDGLA